MKLHNREEWDKNMPNDKGSSNCPFCNWYNDEPEYIIQEYTHWYIVHNKYPVLWLDNHLMAIPRKHTVLSKDLSDEELLDYRNVATFIHDFYKWKRYFSFIRESVKNRSLEHLHYHFLPGNICYDDIESFLKKQGF